MSKNNYTPQQVKDTCDEIYSEIERLVNKAEDLYDDLKAIREKMEDKFPTDEDTISDEEDSKK